MRCRRVARAGFPFLVLAIFLGGLVLIGALDGWGARDDWLFLILLAGFFAIAAATDIFIRYVFRRRP